MSTCDDSDTATVSMDIWPRVDALVERTRTVSDLHYHRLYLYAAWRWRALGRPVPGELLALERSAAALRLAMSALVERVREAYDGPIVLLKGADVAALYPRPELRPSSDLDVLVSDAESVYRALLEYGFEPGPAAPVGFHHLGDLFWPGLPGHVEVHSAPNWPTWLVPPPTEELIAAATPESSVGHGFLVLDPAHHALVLTAHLWRDDPLGRLGHLIDVHLMARRAEPDAVDSLARRWGLARLWSTTQAVASGLLLETDRTFGSRGFTRHLESMRERSVIGARLAETIVPFYALSPAQAAVTAARSVLTKLQPAANETWRMKLTRIVMVLRRAFSPVSVVDAELQNEWLRQHASEQQATDPH